MKTVHLLYFALLREQAGLPQETRTTTASTLAELYEQVAADRGFTLPRERIRVAVGEHFVPWETPVTDSATVVFIPPVAGG